MGSERQGGGFWGTHDTLRSDEGGDVLGELELLAALVDGLDGVGADVVHELAEDYAVLDLGDRADGGLAELRDEGEDGLEVTAEGRRI